MSISGKAPVNAVEMAKNDAATIESHKNASEGRDAILDRLDAETASIVASLTPERRQQIEKKLKLKIDFILFPMLLIFYILNYIVSFRFPNNLFAEGLTNWQDRGALAFAKLVGIEDDLNLTSTQLYVVKSHCHVICQSDNYPAPLVCPSSTWDTVWCVLIGT